MNPLDQLRERIRVALGGEDPLVREDAARVAADLAVLGTRAALGEDVSVEVRHVRAQAANLAAAVQQQVQTGVVEWVQQLFTGVIVGALTA